jgi:hypothetical protein
LTERNAPASSRPIVVAERRSRLGTALLMVRAELADAADRPAFDRWYQSEHLPDAVRVFQAVGAWRCWSETDPSVHYAFYQFADVEAAQAVLRSDGMRGLIAEFDRAWGARVRRSRDILHQVQSLPPKSSKP